MAKLQYPVVMGAIPTTYKLLGEGKTWMKDVEADGRPFVLLEKFEGQRVLDGKYLLRAVFLLVRAK